MNEFVKFMEITTDALEKLESNDNILEKKMKLLEEAMQVFKKLSALLNEKVTIMDKQISRISKSTKVDYKEDVNESV